MRRLARRIRTLYARRQSGGEGGFTLIELMIVLVIMPLVIGAVSIVMITTLKATSDPTGTNARLAQSHDSQITSTYFDRDVQSATRITTASSPLLCSIGAGGTQVLGLMTDGGSSAVSYAVKTMGTPAIPVLVRYYCPTGGPNSTSTLAHTLQTASPPSVALTLACNSSYDSNCTPDAKSSVIPTLDVFTVQMQVTLQMHDSHGALVPNSALTFSVTSSPRQSLGTAATTSIVAATPPLLLLGPGVQCGPGSENLSVNGVLAVNSAAAGSIDVGKVLTASEVYTQNTHGAGSGGPVNASYSGTYATGPTLTDPYASLPPPNPTGPNTFVYTTKLTTGNDGSGKLKSGIYILQAGMSANLTSDPGGVFFYVTGGSISLGGNSNLNLSAMTTGPYAGVLVYQVPSDTSGISLQGTPSINSLDGVIDVSSAAVHLGGNASISALGLVANSMDCNGNTDITLGPQSTTTVVQVATPSTNPSLSGQPVTFNAVVSSQAGPAAGSVTFAITAKGGGTVSCIGGNTQTLDATGTATCTTSTGLTNTGSPYTVAATFPGSLGFQSSSGSLTQVVQVVSTTSVNSSQNPSVSGQAVTFTATVAGTGPPSGNVTFTVSDKNNKKYTCTGGNSPPLAGGQAQCLIPAGQLLSTISPITVGVAYPGDTNNTASSGSLTQTVNPGTLHLAALSGTGSTPDKKGNWQATVTLTVVDGNGSPVSGVVVSGSWNPAVTPTGCTTGANGQCSPAFTTGNIKSTTLSDTWTISNLVLAGYAYLPASNIQNSVTITHP